MSIARTTWAIHGTADPPFRLSTRLTKRGNKTFKAYQAINQTAKPILVTGATGRQGGTGRAVAKVLVERGLPARALVRTLDERAEALRELGLEIVVGDFSNYRSLVAALDGVESAYLLPGC